MKDKHNLISDDETFQRKMSELDIGTIDIKLFGKWDTRVEVRDPSLKKYINVTPVYLPHTGGRHEHRKFGKGR